MLNGKYELLRVLGERGMGEVYEGRQTKVVRPVAVKFLPAHDPRHPGVARRFQNEVRAAGATGHENIAAVFDAGVAPDGAYFLVMEPLEGEDLAHLLKRERRLALRRAADIVSQVCLGLEAVHRRRIVHRDLTPANLFITRRGDGTDLVKILDFGIAKLMRVGGDAGGTKTGLALGPTCYMSPEQARGDRAVAASSDVYALGVIFYELLSGRKPHEGDSLVQVLHRVRTELPTPLERLCPGLPSIVYATVEKAMAPHPRDRLLGVTAFRLALAEFTPTGRAAETLARPPPRSESAVTLRVALTSSIPPVALPRSSVSVLGPAANAPPVAVALRKRLTGLAVFAAIGVVGASLGVFSGVGAGAHWSAARTGPVTTPGAAAPPGRHATTSLPQSPKAQSKVSVLAPAASGPPAASAVPPAPHCATGVTYDENAEPHSTQACE